MKKIEREAFIEGSKDILNTIVNTIEGLPALRIKDLRGEDSVLVIVDMVNGFVNEGPLKSDRVKELIPAILHLIKLCQRNKIDILAFLDTHSKNCPEFESYPGHCILGTSESELVEEIRDAGEYTLINKNSTNGFLEAGFKKWLEDNKNITNFILAGDCTDLCVLQFSLTLKAYFNMNNIRSNIIVPMNVIETYDLDMHNANLMNVFALYNMLANGIKVVQEIQE